VIAVDAMGGDFAPRAVVRGAFQAAREGVSSILYGDAPSLELLLSECDPAWHLLPLSIVHCSEVIEMGDAPSRTVIKKKDSSLVRAIQAVADGQADAVLSAGNSGAAVVAGTVVVVEGGVACEIFDLDKTFCRFATNSRLKYSFARFSTSSSLL